MDKIGAASPHGYGVTGAGHSARPEVVKALQQTQTLQHQTITPELHKALGEYLQRAGNDVYALTHMSASTLEALPASEEAHRWALATEPAPSDGPAELESKQLCQRLHRQVQRSEVQARRLLNRYGPGEHQHQGQNLTIEPQDGRTLIRIQGDTQSRNIWIRPEKAGWVDVQQVNAEGGTQWLQGRPEGVQQIQRFADGQLVAGHTQWDGAQVHWKNGPLLPTSSPQASQQADASSKEPSWEDDMKPLPGDTGLPPASMNDLKATLNVGDDFKGCEAVKTLCDALGLDVPNTEQRFGTTNRKITDGSAFMSHLVKIVRTHGKAVLNQICSELLKFLGEAENGGWSKSEAKSYARYVLEDVARPSQIDQREKGTCAGAAVQRQLAALSPLEYVKMSTQLALGKSYRAADGSTVKPNDSWKGDSNDSRRPTDKVMQAAIMTLAKSDYDSKRDGDKGMSPEARTKILQKLMGPKADQDLDMNTFGTKLEAEYLWRLIEDDLARGQIVSVSFKGHAVNVVGFDKTTDPPTVHILSWGERYTMTLPAFLKHIQSAATEDHPGLDNRKVKDKTILV